jgi:amino acid transporter
MKLIAYLLGIALIAIAVVYFVTPADHLPAFFPGHAADVARIHMKHGIVAGGLGVVLLAIGWFLGRR